MLQHHFWGSRIENYLLSTTSGRHGLKTTFWAPLLAGTDWKLPSERHLSGNWSPISDLIICIYDDFIKAHIFNQLLRTEPIFRDRQLWSYSRTPQNFTEPGCSLKSSQESPPIPILSRISPVYTIQAYPFNIHLNIILPPTSWFPSVIFPITKLGST
jgi:hypothetical protein